MSSKLNYVQRFLVPSILINMSFFRKRRIYTKEGKGVFIEYLKFLRMHWKISSAAVLSVVKPDGQGRQVADTIKFLYVP